MLIDSVSGLSPKTIGEISGLRTVQVPTDYGLPAQICWSDPRLPTEI